MIVVSDQQVRPVLWAQQAVWPENTRVGSLPSALQGEQVHAEHVAVSETETPWGCSVFCSILYRDWLGCGSVWSGRNFLGRPEVCWLPLGTGMRSSDRDEILRPYPGAVGYRFRVMYDNARPHVAVSAAPAWWRHWCYGRTCSQHIPLCNK